MKRLPALLALLVFSFAHAREVPPPKIILDQASAEIFPEGWRGGKINVSAQPLLETEIERFRRVVERTLAKYPKALLERSLVKLYGLGHLEYHGVVTGGTRSEGAIYVVCKPHYSDLAVERIIHAEYSSVLFQKFAKDFDAEAWKRQNAEGANYFGSGVAAVKAGKTAAKATPELQEQGFISEYAQASIEEDFNSHVARLFIGDETYWQTVEKYPRLKSKAELVMAFYEKLDASMSLAKFAELRENASKLTLARIFTDKEFEEEKMETFIWSMKEASYLTLEKPAQGKNGKDIVIHEAATGKDLVAFTAQNLTPKGAKKPLEISDVQVSKNDNRLLLFTNTKKVWRKNTRGDYWLLNMLSNEPQKLGGDAKPSTLMFAKFSPDSRRVAYVRENNLEVQNLADMKITPLTSDGSKTIINGTADWVNEEELGLRDCFRWSPDGSNILFWQFDTSGVKTFSLVNQTDGTYPKFTRFPYPKAGEKNSATRLGVVKSSGGEVTWLKIPGDAREHYIPSAEWTPDGKAVLVQQFNRLQNTLHVMLADPASGEVKTLFTETDKAWVENKNSEPKWIGDDFLWLSERTGWRHAYRVNLAGKMKPITTGDFDVIEINKVNDSHLYFTASPENATQRYLYNVSLDGGEPKRVSPADQPGTHSYSISEDGKWAIHTFSNVTTPPVVTLITLPAHEVVRVLKKQSSLKEKLAIMKLPKTQFLSVDIGGGITVDGWTMSMPSLDKTKKHPLLMNVYGEPAGQTVKDSWGGQKWLYHAMLAQQGYVIASVDTRGTPAPKGRDWRKAVYRQLGIMNSAEEAAAVRALLKSHSFLDPKRVGIWGWSGGGSSSLDALFRYPDLYRTAIAVAPVPDRALYDSIYEERYMGLPKDNVKGYTEGSPITHAKNLKGNLLIIHGTGDDNVHYQGVEKLMNVLVEHNKPFTVMPYPNRDHAINTGKGISRHLYELMTSYLNTHLMSPP